MRLRENIAALAGLLLAAAAPLAAQQTPARLPSDSLRMPGSLAPGD